MKGRIINISAKGDHVKVLIEKKVGPVVSQIKGWMKKADDCKINDEFELPETAQIDTFHNDGYVEMVIT